MLHSIRTTHTSCTTMRRRLPIFASSFRTSTRASRTFRRKWLCSTLIMEKEKECERETQPVRRLPAVRFDSTAAYLLQSTHPVHKYRAEPDLPRCVGVHP